MSIRPTDPVPAPADDEAEPAESAAPRRRAIIGRQQRFEESRVGRRVITGIILVILGVQVIWSMPDSAIRRGLMPVVEPANAINLSERWSMFAPDTGTRVFWFEVDVTMADGTIRVWKDEPRSPLEKIFLPSRWPLLTETSIRQQDGRRDFARWVVDKVTGPSDRPAKVTMLYHFTVLAPPGQPSKGATQTKVLYEEALAGQR